MLVRLAALGTFVGALALAGGVRAQDEVVALVVIGADRECAANAFLSFAAVPEHLRFEAAPEVPPDEIEMLVRIDTDAPTVRVWRRRDGVTLERRFEEATDGYALAVVASELVEVARTGADPATVGAVVVEETPAATAETTLPPEVETPPEAPPPEVVPEAVADTPPPPAADEGAPWVVEVTPGVGVEGWLSLPEPEPWIVQPTLFVELLAGQEGWRFGGAIFASAAGGWSQEAGGFETRYARHEVGLRLGVGGDLGPIGTRLLAHVRGGASLVVGGAGRQGIEDDDREQLVPSGFVGLSLDLRQPIVAGLEVFLEVGADLLPAPVRFTAFGATLVVEPDVRLAGRLGLAWRIQ
ncbi:MAG: hypothetical protein R3B82_07145 [Sandaracinaceae bacterium]